MPEVATSLFRFGPESLFGFFDCRSGSRGDLSSACCKGLQALFACRFRCSVFESRWRVASCRLGREGCDEHRKHRSGLGWVSPIQDVGAPVNEGGARQCRVVYPDRSRPKPVRVHFDEDSSGIRFRVRRGLCVRGVHCCKHGLKHRGDPYLLGSPWVWPC